MTRIYISGPMTGLPEFNVPAFREAAQQLRAAGWDVCSPVEIGEQHGLDQTADVPWSTYMRHDIRALCDCDAVALLPGWYASRGAALEVHVACAIGLRVEEVAHWLYYGVVEDEAPEEEAA